MATVKTVEFPILWLPYVICPGCLVSILNSTSPAIKNVLLNEMIPDKHANLRSQTNSMAGIPTIRKCRD